MRTLTTKLLALAALAWLGASCSLAMTDLSKAPVENDTETGTGGGVNFCEGYPGDNECCDVENTCAWDNDGFCDCDGFCEWEADNDCASDTDTDTDTDSDSDTDSDTDTDSDADTDSDTDSDVDAGDAGGDGG